MSLVHNRIEMRRCKLIALHFRYGLKDLKGKEFAYKILIFVCELTVNSMNDRNNDVKLPRMRTVPRAYAEIKAIDPDTDLSMRGLRDLVSSGTIPTVKIKNKVLINLDLLIEWLSCYNDTATCA